MQLEIFRTLWGYLGDKAQAVAQTREAGFDGLEARMPLTPAERAEFGRSLASTATPYICTLFTAHDVLPAQAASAAQHLADLEQKLAWASELAPRFCNVLAGNDRWPVAQQVEFFGQALDVAARSGLQVLFETHRGRSFYSPWPTLEVIRQLPALRFTSDISHWVVCCERLLDDPFDDLQPFIERVVHIQARVGYDQGPQVPHPAAPEYARELAFHQAHWEAIWACQRARGETVTTLTPEFGADGYLHQLPFTAMPVADLWQLNQWMARTERAHFADFTRAGGAHD
ncbi:sugar phosphate isomerase/epimerase family protein [Pseudomonas typographi]|uniref:sugar phosphate isomerase/epimerase family protein n=1 Tax=Pseudomonas typographi TaxID=2715964 RepID=UPI001689ED4C|nr:TIM barrel protein [Pseudomonas typographi]MBD1555088.1 sugar phosphate isomerase/epimerase [Pseudomonas typographi]